jgi:hypothetical protein
MTAGAVSGSAFEGIQALINFLLGLKVISSFSFISSIPRKTY